MSPTIQQPYVSMQNSTKHEEKEHKMIHRRDQEDTIKGLQIKTCFLKHKIALKNLNHSPFLWNKYIFQSRNHTNYKMIHKQLVKHFIFSVIAQN